MHRLLLPPADNTHSYGVCLIEADRCLLLLLCNNICAPCLNLSAVHCSIDAQHYNNYTLKILVIVILFDFFRMYMIFREQAWNVLLINQALSMGNNDGESYM